MNVISDFIDEDREFRDQLRRIRRDEIKQLEDIVTGRFEKEAQVSCRQNHYSSFYTPVPSFLTCVDFD